MLSARVVIGLVLLCLAVSALIVPHIDPLTPDSCQYLAGAVSIFSGSGFLDANGKPDVLFPPGYSLAIGLVNTVVRDPIFSGLLVSLLASALTVIPLVLMSSELFGSRAAAVTGLAYALLPQRAVRSCMVWSESFYLLVILLAAYVWLLQVRRPKWWQTALVGAMFGLAYLVRPEGLLVGLAVLLLSMLLRRWCQSPPLRMAVAAFVVMCLVSSPYVIYLKQHTNHWSLTCKAGRNLAVAEARSQSGDWNSLVSAGSSGSASAQAARSQSAVSILKRWVRNAGAEAATIVWIIGVPLVACLLLGLVQEINRSNRRALPGMPIVLGVASPLLVLPVFFIETRLVYPSAVVLLLPACWILLKRFSPDGETAPRRTHGLAAAFPVAVVLLLYVCSIAVVLVSAHRSSESQIAAWARRVVPVRCVVMTDSPMVAFRAGRKFVQMPSGCSTVAAVDYARHSGVQYVLLSSRTRMSGDLMDVALGKSHCTHLKPVSRWAEGRDWAMLYEVNRP